MSTAFDLDQDTLHTFQLVNHFGCTRAEANQIVAERKARRMETARAKGRRTTIPAQKGYREKKEHGYNVSGSTSIHSDGCLFNSAARRG